MTLASDVRVPGEGPVPARIMFVGESPGQTEVGERRPFVGQAGRVLDGLLNEVGISRQEVYIDNICQFRPKNNKFEELEGTEVLEQEKARLFDTIKRVKPNIVVCLGEKPLTIIGGKEIKGGITNWRGSVFAGMGDVKVIGTFHPSYLLRAWSDRPLTAHDLRRAHEESWFPEVRKKERAIEYNLPIEVLYNRLADFRNSPFLAFDIETDIPNRRILSISIADSPEYALVVPFMFKGRTFWTPQEEENLKKFIKELLESRQIQKIAQNGQFDIIWLKDQWGIHVNPLFMDTMVAHSLLMPEYDKSLAFQCSIYTDINYYKQDLKSDDVEVFLRYNGTDALATFDCAMSIQEQLEEDGLWEFYLNLPHRLLEPLREMSLRGIRIDHKLRGEMHKTNTEETKRLITVIREEPTCHEFEKRVIQNNAKEKIVARWHDSKSKAESSGRKPSKANVFIKYPTPEAYIEARKSEIPDFNPSSPAQLQQYLYAFRGWKPILEPRAGGGRTPTANQAALKKLQAQYNEPVLQAFIDLADLNKESEFLKAELEPDGRIHCTYDITGTETGRISSKKYVYDTGANLQNQPAGKRKESTLRRIFIPDKGKVFIQRDLKQAEAWVVAYLSQDPFFMEALRSDDIHRATASLIFRKPKEMVTKRERELAKRCVHALNYGMGYMKFAETVGISSVEARDLRNRYFAAFPRLQLWHAEVKSQLARDRVMTTPLGRKREFAAGWNEDLWKEAWAFVPQSTVGDLLNIGFLEFWDWLKSPVAWALDADLDKVTGVRYQLPEYPLLKKTPVGRLNGPALNEDLFDCQTMLQNHDALLAQCPEEHSAVITKRMKECLERPITINGHTITIPTDCSMGTNWFDLKEIADA